jgi:hypothetical protein
MANDNNPVYGMGACIGRKARLALFEHWLKIKNRAAPAVKREAGPRTTIKS